MTAKEALKWLFLKASKQHGALWAIKLTKPYDSRKKLVDEITSDLDNHGGEFNDALNIIEQALTELEELKRDVKRYFELEKRLHYIDKNANTPFEIEDMKQTHRETLKEMFELETKLLKVGKEE